MKIKKVMLSLMTAVMITGTFSMTAFANAKEPADEAESVAKEEQTENAEESGETGDALTPDGNMTLVDDVGSETEAGKQFITMVTKSGNYFYLIIDRDDEGEQTMHFLNQVDEADLMALMDEEQSTGLTQSEETANTETVAPDQETVEETEPAGEESVKEETTKKQEEKKSGNILPAIILLAAVVIGGGVFAFMKLKGKKEQEKEKPDPDDEYQDEDDEEYLIPDDFEDQEEDMKEDEEEQV